MGNLFLGEGYGNPLSYSCLENPMERGAWWAAVHGVTQSQIRLKRLSSSSSSLPLLQQIFPTQELTRVSYIAGRFFTNWLSGKPIDLSTFSHIKISYFNAVIKREIFMRVEKLLHETKNSLAKTFGILIKCYDCTNPSFMNHIYL